MKDSNNPVRKYGQAFQYAVGKLTATFEAINGQLNGQSLKQSLTMRPGVELRTQTSRATDVITLIAHEAIDIGIEEMRQYIMENVDFSAVSRDDYEALVDNLMDHIDDKQMLINHLSSRLKGYYR